MPKQAPCEEDGWSVIGHITVVLLGAALIMALMYGWFQAPIDRQKELIWKLDKLEASLEQTQRYIIQHEGGR